MGSYYIDPFKRCCYNCAMAKHPDLKECTVICNCKDADNYHKEINDVEESCKHFRSVSIIDLRGREGEVG